ncbi:MAG TPA: hypothetical protein VH331_05720 [Allosphingosinicella sp.]|jgi:hypothetical protein|nr:hypothetical protein [Allosphingosinicella sp.]
MRRISVAITLCALAAAMPAQARYVSPGYDKSWGKPGVSFVDYRNDAVSCGRQAAGLDLAHTGPARSFVAGSRILENGSDYDTWATALRVAAPQHNIEKAGDLLEAALERCLHEHGYHKFRLTAEQRHQLRKLPIGSDERHHYLYSLGSDPGVLAKQAIE